MSAGAELRSFVERVERLDAEIRSFVERVERLDAEIGELNRDKADVFAEAKASGFDVKAMKAVIKRRRDGHKADEHEALVELYWRELNAPHVHARVEAAE